MKIGNVLSLFDGMSCARIALDRAGIQYDRYYASEIDKPAIKVASTNYPDTIHLGDVTKVKASELPRIDLLCGGSPCQGFSFAGKGLNFDDPRSKLFFEFVRLLKEIRVTNHNVLFLLENVKMKKEHENVISELLEIQPIEINSALVSAQNRVRLYWTNIAAVQVGLFGHYECSIPQPKDTSILLKDILEESVAEKYYISDKVLRRMVSASKTERGIRPHRNDEKKSGISEIGTIVDTNNKSDTLIASHQPKIFCEQFGVLNDNGEIGDKSTCVDANYFKGVDSHAQRTMILQRERGYNEGGIKNEEDGKTPPLTSNSWEHNNFLVEKQCDALRGRNPDNPKSREAGLPTEQQLEARKDEKTNTLTTVQKDNLVLEREIKQLNPNTESGGIQPYQQNRIYDSEGIKPSLLAEMSSGTHAILHNSKIRRLTPLECERLQTVPDRYTECVSDTQRYKMLGNGWTIDVIAHILSYIK